MNLQAEVTRQSHYLINYQNLTLDGGVKPVFINPYCHQTYLKP